MISFNKNMHILSSPGATLAHMWHNIAGANGSEIAREWRDTIEDDMTATQIARATELARTCMDSDYENCEG